MTYGFEGAIFDMDGTLLDSMPYWRIVGIEYLLKHGIPVTREEFARALDTPGMRLTREVCEKTGVPFDSDAVLAELESVMERRYLEDVRHKPAIQGFLEELKRRGIKMCVATSTTRPVATRALEAQGLAGYFDFIEDTFECGMNKGQPEYFEYVSRKLGVPLDRCMVFEDALYSIRTAKAVGCMVCAIEDITAERQREEIRALSDVYIQSYEELLR
jgi:HAD superfamily hydrolase (TIGR01509 family)